MGINDIVKALGTYSYVCQHFKGCKVRLTTVNELNDNLTQYGQITWMRGFVNEKFLN